jgi:Arylsulfatase A and related enzymes
MDSARLMNKSPNVLVILSDQLRRQALGVYGDPEARTPHVDRLAAEGVRFAQACATSPICVPFRFTLMTGEYAHTRKVPGIEYAMSPAERTLADEFNEAGYETIYVGKWHLDGGHGRLGSAAQVNRTRVPRSRQGRWQTWQGFELRNDPLDTWIFENDDPVPKKLAGYQTDALFDRGMECLRRRRGDRPFCLVISVEPPHDPFVAPPDLQAAWEAREISLPPNFAMEDAGERERVIRNRKRYAAMVENLDANIGRMRDFLDETGLAKNTVTVFLSDHGELGGAHGLEEKQWPYEESVGIPLIVHDPRHSERAGRVIEDPTCTEDLFPTLLGLAGLRPKNTLPGADLTPLIHGKVDRLAREGVMLEFVAELRPERVFSNEPWRAFRTRRFKYTVKGNNLGGTPWQFFDLATDPFELNNLVDAPEHAAEIARHHDLLRDRILETQDHFVLLPAFGRKGANCWMDHAATIGDSSL